MVRLPVACKPRDRFKLPAKELDEVAPLEKKAPEVLNPVAVTVFDEVRDLARFREPANESEPAPVSIRRPAVEMLPVEWRPNEVLILPEKELEPVLEDVIVPLVVMLPPIEA